ncbi:MAG: DUF1848 domain-containing protein [Bacteroidales bacterium]
MSFQGWPEITISNDKGEDVNAKAPFIISASRATDIPAFYADWFFNRLQKGYLVWKNPFNGKATYISFANTKFIIFWSKNPKPIIPYLRRLDKLKIGYYFHFTLNDYETENLEPNVPSLHERLNTFKNLSGKIGKERVIWRFDPIIKTDHLSPSMVLERIEKIGNLINEYTTKLVFSFIQASPYKKVQNRLFKNSDQFSSKNPMDYEFTEKEKKIISSRLQKMAQQWNIGISSCAEPTDLSMYNISHNKCIDDNLIRNLYPNSKSLIHFLNTGKTNLKEKPQKTALPCLKDKGQRPACKCIYSKDIGKYNTCPHLCLYCYANSNPKTTLNNFLTHRTKNNTI